MTTGLIITLVVQAVQVVLQGYTLYRLVQLEQRVTILFDQLTEVHRLITALDKDLRE